MTMNTAAASKKRFNPVFWIMWLLPGSAVFAGFTTLALALGSGDRPLPEEYHWEGDRLDRDFARARSAAALGVEVTLEVRGGQCHALLNRAADDVTALNVLLTHGSDASLDRRLRLARVAAGDYRAPCAPLASGKWRVAVDADAASWALRGVVDTGQASAVLSARSPDGGAS
jgi:hypothetical protein